MDMEIDQVGFSPKHRDASPSRVVREPASPKISAEANSPRKMMTVSPKKAPQESPMADNEESSDELIPDSFFSKGPRSRKTVDRFIGSSPVPVKAKKVPAESSGSGIPLGEISKIADKLYKTPTKYDALKRLHRVLFGSDGQATARKKAIRLWNGTESEEVKKSMKYGLSGVKSVNMLKDICGILAIAVGGDRTSIEERIFEFLVKPTGSTAPLKPKSKKTKSKKSKSPKKEKSKSKPASKESGASPFSLFMQKRLPEIRSQAGSDMSARDMTELLTVEWGSMSAVEKAQFSAPKKDKVQKVIKKSESPRKKKETDSGRDSSSSSGSDSDSSSGSSSDDESSSSDSGSGSD
jgi:hypothetical protein